MIRVFQLTLLIIANPLFGQKKIKYEQIYNKTIENYLIFVSQERNTHFDTLYIESSDTINYHLSPKINNTVIKVLKWADLADKIDQNPNLFYVRLAPLSTSAEKLTLGIFGNQVEIENGQKRIGAQRRFERVTFISNHKRTKYILEDIKTAYGFCGNYFIIEKITKKLILVEQDCILTPTPKTGKR